MLNDSAILWVLLTAVALLTAYLHLQENKSLKKIDSTFSLRKFAWKRSTQLMAVILCYSFIILAYDAKLKMTRLDLIRLESSQAQVDDILAAINPAPASPETQGKTEQGEIETDPMSDMFHPKNSDTDKQSKLDVLKNRYEEILVTHFFLRKCTVAPASDYHIIMSALAVEMASINAPGRLQYDILTAARGSYKEMYSKTSCSPENLSSIKPGYTDYINSISKNIISP